MPNNCSSTFKAIYAGVRPAKVVTLINENDKDWINTSFRVIEWYSQMWGGRHNLIVPTNGRSVREEFWFLTEAFDPDYVYSYRKTMLDFKLSSPEEYSKWLEQQVENFVRQNPASDREFTRESIDGQIVRIEIDQLVISDPLQHEILNRLNPFHYEGHPIKHTVSALDGVHYPLTSLTKIIPNTDLVRIVDLEADFEKAIQLIIYSATGMLSSFQKNLSNELQDLHESGRLQVAEPERHIEMLKAIQEKINLVRYSNDDLWDLLQLTWTEGREPSGMRDHFQYMPFSTTMLKLALYYRGYPEYWRTPVIVVVGDTINDFCLYYNLSRLRREVYWLPIKLLQNSLKTVDAKGMPGGVSTSYSRFLFALVAELNNRISYGHSEKKIILTSFSKSEDELSDVKGELDCAYPIKIGEGGSTSIKDSIWISREIKKLLPYVSHVFEENNFPNYYGTEQFINGESVNYINTPTPKNFSIIDPNGHYWVAEIGVEGYELPAKPALSTMIIKHTPYSANEIRVSKYGIDYHCPNISYFGGDIDTVLVKPKLVLPDAFEVFKAIFEEVGYYICLSDKGDFERISISKFGSLEDAAKTFLNEKCRQLFDKIIDEAPNRQGVYDEGVLLDKKEPRYMDLTSFGKIVGSETETRSLLNNFLGKEILHRGFILKCSRCRNADWYSISEVTDTFRCRRCGFEQTYGSTHLRIQEEKERLEPRWYYRLDEVIYQGYKHDMIVPLLTLYKLQKSAKESFLFIPEIEIRRINEEKSSPYSEIDICCILDGEIIIGECKRSNKLEDNILNQKKTIKRYKELADKVGANEVLFATFSNSWNANTAKVIEEIFKNSRVRRELLSGDDLLN